MVSGMSSSSADKAVRADRGSAGLAVLTLLVQTIGTTFAARGQETQLDLLGYVLLVVSALVLGARHLAPTFTMAVVAACTLTYLLLDYPTGPTFIAAAVMALSAVKNSYKAVWPIAFASWLAWSLIVQPGFGEAFKLLAWMVGVGVFLEVVLGAGKLASKMAQEQRRAHQEKQRRQASEERLRIAQELHDVLGHHLSLINVRAGVGRHLMDRQPDQARAALDTIKEASAEALREVQSVLHTLYPSGQEPPRRPQPTIARLDELTVDAGLAVHTTIGGDPRPLPAEIDRAAYRIVQEALTNVRRHAGPGAQATITVDYTGPDQLVVRIQDDGGASLPLAGPAAEGNGVSGMRERATTLGGTLTAHPLPEGGWRVHAELPLPPAAEVA